MTSGANIAVLNVPIRGDPSQLNAALAAAERRLLAFNATATRAAGSSSALATATRSTAQASGEAAAADQRLLLTRQRLATATEQTRAATARAATAEASAASAMSRAEAAALRLASSKDRLAAASARAASGQASFGSTVAGAASKIDGLIGTVQGLAGAFAVINAGQQIYALAATGAAAQAARTSFDRLAASAGTTGAALLTSLQKAAAGTVAQVDLIKSSNTALLLLGSTAATQLPALLEVAKASATALGTDVGEVFNSLVTGISRGSTELIDNAGITLKAGDAYAAYAAQIGVGVDALTAQQKQQALLNGVLTAGQTIIAQTSGGAEGSAIAFQRAAAAGADLQNVLAGLLANGLAPAAKGFADLAAAAAGGLTSFAAIPAQQAAINEAILTSSLTYADFTAKIGAATLQLQTLSPAAAAIVGPMASLTEAQFTYAQALIASGVATSTALSEAEQFGVITIQNAGAFDITGESATALAEAQYALALATGEASGSAGTLVTAEDGLIQMFVQAEQAALSKAEATDIASAANLAALAAAQEGAAGELLAALASDELTESKRVLTEQARLAAQSLLAGGDAGAAAASRLAQSSSLVDQLTAAYYRLAASQQAAATGGGAVSSALKGVAGGAAAETVALRSRLAALKNFNGTPVGGNTPPRSSSGGGRSSSPRGGAPARAAESKEAKAEKKAADDQVKAEAALLAKLRDIQKTYYADEIKAQTTYQEKVLSIQLAYAEKQKKAQDDLIVSSKQSKYAFYDELTSSDLPEAVQQQLSAAYEEAFAQAQKYSQEGNAQLAADFLALKQAQLAAELGYQQELAAAKASGDDAEVARLVAINRLRLEAEKAQLDKLLAGGDANTTDRDTALGEASVKLQEDLAAASTKVGDATALAQEKGKAATDKANLGLKEQLALLNQISAQGGGGPGTGLPGPGTGPRAGGGDPAAGSGAATQAAQAGAGGATAVLDTEVVAAIVAMRDALSTGIAGVERAVSGIANRPNYSPGG